MNHKMKAELGWVLAMLGVLALLGGVYVGGDTAGVGLSPVGHGVQVGERPGSTETGMETERVPGGVSPGGSLPSLDPAAEGGEPPVRWRLELDLVDPSGAVVGEARVGIEVHMLLSNGERLPWMEWPLQDVASPTGVYRFSKLAPPSEEPLEFRLHIQAPGFQRVAEVFAWGPEEGLRVERQVLLTPGHTVLGLVFDDQGPVEGAHVWALMPGNRVLGKCQSEGPGGEFQLQALGQKPDAIWVQKEGYGPERVGVSDLVPGAFAMVNLRPGAELQGRLLDFEGHGLAGQVVRVLFDGPGGMGARVPLAWVRATTDEAGRFRLTGLPAGVWPVEWMPDASPTSGSRFLSGIEVREQDRIVRDFVLGPEVVLEGRVELPSGLDGSLMFLQVLDGEKDQVLARWSGTGRDYRIAGEFQGEVVVRLVEGDGPGVDRRVRIVGAVTQVPAFEYSDWGRYQELLAR